MKKDALKIFRNLLIFVAGLAALAVIIAAARGDVSEWLRVFEGLGVWLLIGIVMMIVGTLLTIAIKGTGLLAKLGINRLTGGKVEYFAREAERVDELKKHYAEVDYRNNLAADWFRANFTLTRKPLPENVAVSTDCDYWFEGYRMGVKVAFHDPNPYHFEVFVGDPLSPRSFHLKRIYPGEARAAGCITLDGFYAGDEELAKKFWLAEKPSNPTAAKAILFAPAVKEALSNLSNQVYFVSVFERGVELRMGKAGIVVDLIGKDIDLGLAILEDLESRPGA